MFWLLFSYIIRYAYTHTHSHTDTVVMSNRVTQYSYEYVHQVL